MPSAMSKSKSRGRDHRRSRSRNTTPSSIGTTATVTQASPTVTALLQTPLSQLIPSPDLTYSDIWERLGSGASIPDAKHLLALSNDLELLKEKADARWKVCDAGMRGASQRRMEKLAEEQEKEMREREEEERKERMRKEETLKAEEDESRGRRESKSRHGKDRSKGREPRPLTHGAHGVARQDGMDTEMKDAVSPAERRGSQRSDPSPGKVKKEVASGSSSSLSPPSQAHSPSEPSTKKAPSIPGSPGSSSSLSDEQPPPAPAVTQFQTFGPDPSTFDDPTIYHIREINDDMTEEEIKEIYSVAHFPGSDLHDLVPGTPPDRDFSNAKPTNQVSANTFASYIEPYFRPFTEEDLAFLRERGDHARPFVIPRRGKRHYSEIWAEEDGAMAIDSRHRDQKLPGNQSRGSIEQMNEEAAESEQVSAGPLLQRLLAAMRPEHRPDPNDEKAGDGLTNDIKEESADAENTGENDKPLPAASFIPDSTQPGWKVPTTKLDYQQIDERLKQELRYIGFLGEESEPDYDAHYDDELAARLRHLQAELKEQTIINGARKARIGELAKERLAHQEFTTILEDLDTQVQSAYLKRTRTMGKGSKKHKRPGGTNSAGAAGSGAAGQAVSRPGIGDVARTLMERRKKWVDIIQPVFDRKIGQIPNDSVFDPELMAALVDKERETWDEGE